MRQLCIITKIFHLIPVIYHSLHTLCPPPLPLVKLGFCLGIGTLGGRLIFFSWDMKTPCLKNSKYKSQAKKNGSDFNFCNFSLLAPYTITNFWQSVFVSLFSMVYTPLYPQMFFLWVATFVCVCVCLVARGQEFLGDLLYQGDLILFQGEGGLVIFFHKAINDQSCKLKKS